MTTYACESVTELESQSTSQPGGHTVGQPVTKLKSQSTSQPGGHTLSQPDGQTPASHSVSHSVTVSQSVSQSVNQSVSQSDSQTVSQSVSQTVSQSVSQSVNQLIDRSGDRSGNFSVNYSLKKSVRPSVNQWVSQSVSQSIYQLVHRWMDQLIRFFASCVIPSCNFVLCSVATAKLCFTYMFTKVRELWILSNHTITSQLVLLHRSVGPPHNSIIPLFIIHATYQHKLKLVDKRPP